MKKIKDVSVCRKMCKGPPLARIRLEKSFDVCIIPCYPLLNNPLTLSQKLLPLSSSLLELLSGRLSELPELDEELESESDEELLLLLLLLLLLPPSFTGLSSSSCTAELEEPLRCRMQVDGI